jgi:hypothetical protein
MAMKIEFENGILRIENARGLRWQLENANKPEFNFTYDALSVSEQHAVRRLGGNIFPLAENQMAEVMEFVTSLSPPVGVTLNKQIVADLHMFAHGLINSVVTQLEYDGLLDVAITAREGSTDLYAEQARRILTYVDTVWNAYYGLSAQINNTSDSELTTLKEYAEMMPFPPAKEHFTRVAPEGLFDVAPSKC